MKGVGAAIASLALLVALAPRPATAIVGGVGDLSEPGVGVGIIVVQPGEDGNTWDGGDARAPSPVYYIAVPRGTGGGDLSGLCFTPEGPPLEEHPLGNGYWHTIEAYERATDRFLGVVDVRCIPLADDGTVATPDLPEPPSIAVIWDLVGIPEPELATSPTHEGITGLETWFWGRNPGVRSLTLTLDGFTVTGSARPEEYRFYVEGRGWVRSDAPGSAATPAARHTFQVLGDIRIGAAVVWRGTFQMTGPGFGAVPVDLGTAVIRRGRDYPVAEVRSLRVEPPAQRPAS